MSNWFSKHLGIKLDSHTLANLGKNLSPVAGTIIGGPLGLAAAGGLSALGDLGRGKNIGEALKGGVENASLAAGGQALGSHFGYHGGLGALGGSSGGATAVPAGTPAPVSPAASGGLASVTPAPLADSTIATGGTIPGGSFDTQRSALSRIGSGASGALKFAGDHDKVTGAVLNTFGGLANSGTENRLRNAQATALEQQADETQYDFDRRKAREAQMAPLWGALGTAYGDNLRKAAPNPYASFGGGQ